MYSELRQIPPTYLVGNACLRKPHQLACSGHCGGRDDSGAVGTRKPRQQRPGLLSLVLAREGDSGLLLRLFGRSWLRRKLKNRCDLPFVQIRQQNYLTIRQLKGVVMHVRDILVYLPETSSVLRSCRNCRWAYLRALSNEWILLLS
jgi:hypothetical protein